MGQLNQCWRRICREILTYLLTYLQSWVLSEKLPIVQLLKIFLEFYGTRMFITVFIRALQWRLSWARSIQSIPSFPVSKIYFNIVHPPTSWSYYWSLFTNILYTFRFSPIRVTFPAHLILLYLTWCREIIFFRFDYHTFHFLYPFVSYLLTVPRTRNVYANSMFSGTYYLSELVNS
jgi:hypothetical protein